jgi:hypothetical protein
VHRLLALLIDSSEYQDLPDALKTHAVETLITQARSRTAQELRAELDR